MKTLKENLHELIEKQEQLMRSEQRYRIVAESTMDIIWEGDLISKKRFFSEKLYDILGYKSCGNGSLSMLGLILFIQKILKG